MLAGDARLLSVAFLQGNLTVSHRVELDGHGI